MLRLFSMLLSIALSQYIDILCDYNDENIALALVALTAPDDEVLMEDYAEIRPYHDGECTFFTSSIMEKTLFGMAAFLFICTCPDSSLCPVYLAAENFMEGYIYLNNYSGENFKINKIIDKSSVNIGQSFNLIADYVDENENPVESLITIDDYLGEVITYTATIDPLNGHAEFDVTYNTIGTKNLRVISEYTIISDYYGVMDMKQISICKISVVDNSKSMNLILNNNDASKQIIWTDEPFSITLQAYELGTTNVDIQEQSSVQITISNSESEDIVFSKTFTNGVAVFDNIIVLKYGSYDIVAVCDGFNNAVMSKNVAGYLWIYFNDGIPYDYNTYFSLVVEVFKDPLFVTKDLKAEVIITLTTNPSTEIEGTVNDITKNGEITFEFLKIPKEGNYQIKASSQWMSNAFTPEFTIYITDKVFGIELTTNSSTNSVRVDDTILITANLLDYNDQDYSSEVIVFLEIYPLLYTGNTAVDSIMGKAYFLISFTNIGSYYVNATTMLDYENVFSDFLSITVYDIYCDLNGIYTKNAELVNGKCQCKKITTYNINTNECVCIENSVFNETTLQCECNEPYKYNNGRCTDCIRTFTKENVIAFYDENYMKIFISFSTGVLEAGPLDCLYLINLPSGLKNVIKYCEWLGNSVMIVWANSIIIPNDYYIELNENLTPDKGDCYENTEKVKVLIEKKYPGPIPNFEIQAPAYASKGNCQSNIIIVSCVPDDNNFSFLWTITGMSTPLTINPIELNPTYFSGIIIFITLNVEYIPFNTSAEKNVSISLSDNLILKVTTNLGRNYPMTKSETVELNPILLDSCGVDVLITEYFFKLISGKSLYFINELIKNRERDDMMLIKAQELDVGTYIIRAGITMGDFSGYEDTQITVLDDELGISFDRWDGIQGSDIDLEVSATTNSTYKNNIEFKWSCLNGDQYCSGPQNQSIFINPLPNKFVIIKYNLQDLKNYTIICYAQNVVTKKSATREIHIQINSGYYGSIMINSIMDLVKIGQEFVIYPRANYDNNMKYIWKFDPLLENCYLNFNNLILKIPPWCLSSSTKYVLSLTALKGNHIGKAETTLQTPEIPKCSKFSIESLENDKWRLDAVGCSSKNSRLTYQYGYKSDSDTIKWLTAELEVNTIDLHIENNITIAVVRVADFYVWIDIESPILRKSRVLVTDNSIIQDYRIINYDTLLADFKYFISEITSTSDYFKFIDKIIDYFTTGKTTQGTFKSFLSFLETSSQTSEFYNIEYAIKFTNAAFEVLTEYNKTLENQEFQDLMSIFDKMQFSYKDADLYLLSSILWSQNIYPFSSGNYSNNIEIAYRHLPLKDLIQTNFLHKNMQISLTDTSELDENYLYCFLYFYINPFNIGVFLYKIAEKISDVSYIPLKTPELVLINNVTYKIQITSDEYVYSDYRFSYFSDQKINETYLVKRIDSDNLYFQVNDNGFFTITSPTKIFRTRYYNLIGLFISALIPTFSVIIIHRYFSGVDNVDYYFREIVNIRNFCRRSYTFILPIIIMQFSIGYLVNLLYNMKMKQNCNSFEMMDLVKSLIVSLIYNICLLVVLKILNEVNKRNNFYNDMVPKKHFFVLFIIWILLIIAIFVIEFFTNTCFNLYWFLFTFLMHLFVTPIIWIPLKYCFNDPSRNQVQQVQQIPQEI